MDLPHPKSLKYCHSLQIREGLEAVLWTIKFRSFLDTLGSGRQWHQIQKKSEFDLSNRAR